jgi:phosphonate transport system ATP-binding protein
LVQGAEVILADEPVASLDPVSARRVMDILRRLNRDDALTVLVTLHQVDYALRYCDRVVALKSGKVVYDGPTGGLDPARLVDIYGPEFEDAYLEAPPS